MDESDGQSKGLSNESNDNPFWPLCSTRNGARADGGHWRELNHHAAHVKAQHSGVYFLTSNARQRSLNSPFSHRALMEWQASILTLGEKRYLHFLFNSLFRYM